MKHLLRTILLLSILFARPLYAQITPVTASSSDIYQELKKLQVLGSVLYIAAHPDDENNGFLPYLAKEKLYRTAYLSLTRGDGGQNLIGPEQGIELGLIRTQELLAARQIDGAEQYFTRAYEFGFSKSQDEALSVWNREQVLADVVWMIRKLQPDILIARFPGDARAGHGHHAASAIIANEAFIAAADPNKFPEQLKYGVKPWQAKRILWNTFNFGNTNTTSNDQLKMDVGGYNVLTGKSYGELGGEARSMHKSQAEGRPRRRGEAFEYFVTTGGDTARTDLMEGINISWNRLKTIPSATLVVDSIQSMIQAIISSYQFTKPEASIPALVKLYQTIRKNLPYGIWKEQKLKEVQDIIEHCAGLFVEAFTQQEKALKGDTVRVNCFINNRSNLPVTIRSIQVGYAIKDTLPMQTAMGNRNFSYPLTIIPTINAETSQPYWLVKQKNQEGMFTVEDQEQIGRAWNEPAVMASFQISIENETFTFKRPVMYKYVDAARGERYQPFIIGPHIELFMSPSVALLQVRDEKGFIRSDSTIHVVYRSNFSGKDIATSLHLRQASNISIFSREKRDFDKGKSYTVDIPVRNIYNNKAEVKYLEATLSMVAPDGKSYHFSDFFKSIQYDHIPNINYFFRDYVKVVDDEIKVTGKLIGYIPGSGDVIPEALQQMGYTVKKLSNDDISEEGLKQFDAIITGVRAYNIHAWLNNKHDVLMHYVEQGGNLIVQYNRNTQGGVVPPKIGPYPFQIAAGSRITEENAAVKFLLPNHPVLNYPNKIGEPDFAGWIQERSTYQAENMDARYEAPLAMHDKNEKDTNGSLITAKYGKGNFAYVSLVLFRQLPAGVPGAFKLLANLIALPDNK